MTHRQVRATFVLAAFIAVVAVLAVVISAPRTVQAPVEVGVITPEPVVADTTTEAPDAPQPVVKRPPAKSAAATPDHRDSPLYHAAPRDDIR